MDQRIAQAVENGIEDARAGREPACYRVTDTSYMSCDGIGIGTDVATAYLTAYAPARESAALSASPIACAVADAWIMWTRRAGNDPLPFTVEGDMFGASLESLEAATRESPLRKVRP